VLGVFDRNKLEDVLERTSGRRGSTVIRAILDQYEEGTTLTESELEERFLAICLNAGLTRPRVNEWIVLREGAVRVDFLWRKERLIVETDGRRFHGTRGAFERDRRCDQRLVLADYRVVRFTWKQITNEPKQVAATVADLLRDRRDAMASAS
jgi:very-short-patch-repair endonuclease